MFVIGCSFLLRVGSSLQLSFFACSCVFELLCLHGAPEKNCKQGSKKQGSSTACKKAPTVSKQTRRIGANPEKSDLVNFLGNLPSLYVGGFSWIFEKIPLDFLGFRGHCVRFS